jgi:hypothetical protein
MTDQYEALEGLDPVMWRTRGPRGGWMAADEVPSFWTQVEPLFSEKTILKLIAENRALRDALEEMIRQEDEYGEGTVHPAVMIQARQALTQGAAHPEQEGGQSHG